MRAYWNYRGLLLIIIVGLVFLLAVVNVDLCLLSSCVPILTKRRLSAAVSTGFQYANSNLGNSRADSVKPHGGCGYRSWEQRTDTCPALYRGDNITLPTSPKTDSSDCPLERLLEDCTLFRQSHEYDVYPVTPEEQAFPIAFSVKLHTNPTQFEQLLRTIYRPHNAYCVHVDQKSDKTVHEIVDNIAKCFDNVYVLKPPINLVYSSFAHIQVELELMKLCLKHKKSWKYYINLAGQDFPLKTNLEMVKILTFLQGQNDIENFVLSFYRRKQFLRKMKIVDNHVVITNNTKERFQYNVYLRKGSTYGLFSRGFVDFMLNDDFVKLFLNWIQDLTPSEEIIWATLNSLPWTPGGSDVEIRHVDGTHLAKAVLWSLDSIYCQGEIRRSVCVFSAKDLPWLKDRHELFANKFDNTFDPIPLGCLEQTLRHRALNQNIQNLQWFRYRHLRQVENPRFQKLLAIKSKETYLSQLKEKWLEENVIH